MSGLPEGLELDSEPGAPDQGAALPEGFELDPTPEEKEAHTDARVGTLFELGLTKAPDKHAGILEVARRTRVPANLVEERFEEFRQSAEAAAFNPRTFRQQNPELAKLLLEQPELGPILTEKKEMGLLAKTLRALSVAWNLNPELQGGTPDEIRASGMEVLKGYEADPNTIPTGLPKDQLFPVREVQSVVDPSASGGTWGKVKRDFELSRAQTRHSTLGFQLLTSKKQGKDTWELEKQLADIEPSLVPRYFNASGGEQLALDAVETLSSQWEALKAGGAGSIIGAGVGLAVGAASGKPGMAKDLAKVGAKAGGLTGGFLASAELETGGAYLEFRGMKTDDGRPVPDELAAGAALAYGVVAGTVEVAAFGQVLKAYGPLAKLVQAGQSKAFMQMALADPRLRSAFMRAGKQWLKAGASEGAEEVVQLVTQDMTGWAARSIAAGGILSNPQKADPIATVDAATDAFRKGAVGGLFMGGPGLAVQTYAERRLLAKGERAAKQVEALTGLAESQTLRAAPPALAKLIATSTEKMGDDVTHVYVDPGQFSRFFQENGADPAQAAQELMGAEGAARLKEAVATGQKLEVPLEEYLEKWGPRPVAQALAEHTTTKSYYLTTAEMAAREGEVKAGQDALVQAYEEEHGKAEKSDAEQRLVDDVAKQLVGSGIYKRRDALTAVKVTQAFVSTMAERFGKDPDELFEHVRIQVQSAQVAEDAASFDFGANAVPVAAQQQSAAPVEVDEAREFVSRMRSPEKKALAESWLAYTQGETKERPQVTPELERELARYGVVDPAGYAFGEDGRSLERSTPGPRSFGEEPAELRRQRLERGMSVEEWQAAGYKTFYQENEERQGPRGFVEFERRGGELLASITLNPNADASTYLHEGAHTFLEMLADLSEREDAPQSVRDDYQATLKFLGVEKRSDIGTEQHEKWARAFESYIYEGKSPSARLTRLFERLKLWLRRVYQKQASLNVELNADIRGVFDRLLATEEEIARAQEKMGLEPLFRTPEEAAAAGIPPAQYPAYLEAQLEATSRAKRAGEVRILKDRLREQQAWWKEEERQLLDEALKEYDARADVRALRYVTKGELPVEEGRAVANSEMGKLDRAAVEAALGPEQAKRVFGNRLKKDGENPDDVAQVFGFPTGPIMLGAIAKVPEREGWAASEAKLRMADRHPDLLEERAELELLLSKHLHSDQTADWLIRELKALASRVGDKDSLPPEAFHRAAVALAEKKSVRTLDPGRALRAERSAAEKAIRAAAKGNFAQAYVYAQQRLLNFYLHRELLAAREERDGFEQLLGDMASLRRREKLGLAGRPFLDTSDSILEALGAKPLEDDALVLGDRSAGLPDLLALMTPQGLEPAFDVAALEAVIKQPTGDWKELTVAGMRNVDAALRQLRKLATAETGITLEGARMELARFLELVDQEASALPKKAAPPASESAAPTGWWMKQRFAGIAAAQADPELLFDYLGPTAARYFWGRYVEQRTEEDALAKRVLEFFQKHWEALPEELQARRYELVDATELPIPEDVNRDGSARDRQWVWMLALNAGNESNLDRLLGGYGWSKEQLFGFLNKTLTKAEWDFIQSVWTLLDKELYPEVARAYEATNGVKPRKIPAVPIVTPHGTYSGGYFPARYDPVAARIGPQQAAEAVSRLFDESARASVMKSFTKSRVTKYTDVINLQWNVVPSHLSQVIHYVAFDGFVREAARALFHGKMRDTNQRRLGLKNQAQLEGWLRVVANAQQDAVPQLMQDVTAVLGGARSRLVMQSIGWSATVALGDLTNPLTAMTEVSPKYMVPALLEHLFRFGPMRREALEQSVELRHRSDNVRQKLQRELAEVGVRGKQGKGGALLERVRETAWVLQELTGNWSATLVWQGSYRQALANGLSKREAVLEADAKVRRTSPSLNPAEQPALLRDKRGIGSVLVFFGYFSKVQNQLRRTWHPFHTQFFNAEDWGGRVAALPEAVKATATTIALFAFMGPVAELLSGRGPDKDEDRGEWLLRKMLAAPFSLVPVFGAFAEPALNKLVTGKANRPFNPRAAPAMAAFQRIYEAAGKLASDDRKATTYLEVLLLSLNLPTSQPMRTVRYLESWGTGEAKPKDPLDVAKGLIYGPPRRKR